MKGPRRHLDPALSRALRSLLAFQLGWLACVLGGAVHTNAAGIIAAAVVVTLHLWRLPAPNREAPLLLIATLMGITLDSLPVFFQFIAYRGGAIDGLAPPWIVAMWPMFATTLTPVFKGLRGRPWLAVALGVLVPGAYYLGAQLGAATFEPPIWRGLLALALIWGIALPVLVDLSARFDGSVATNR